MNELERIARDAMAHLPPEEPKTLSREDILAEQRELVRELGLSGLSDFQHYAAVARWGRQRFLKEREVMGMPIRFAEAVNQGFIERAWRDETGCMAGLLKDGLLALAGLATPDLIRMLKHPRLEGVAKSYTPKAHGGMLVLGPTGIGKSVAGVAVLRRLLAIVPSRYNEMDDYEARLKPKPSLAYCRALDLPNARLQQSLGHGEAVLVDRAKDVDFLVLDDVGWESPRAGADDVVVEVISTRYDLGKPTYVTSGQRRQPFIDRYGEVVMRKITDAGGLPGRVVDCWGDK